MVHGKGNGSSVAGGLRERRAGEAMMKKVKDWKCQECEKLLTLAQAEKAMNGDSGCPGCGGSDIDEA